MTGVYIWTDGGDVVVAQPVLYLGVRPSLPLWHCCRFRAAHAQHAAGVWAMVAHYTCTFLDPAWRTTYAWNDTVDWKEVGTWATSGAADEMRYTQTVASYRYLDFTVPAGHTGVIVFRAATHSGNTDPDEALLELIDKSSSPDRSLKLNGRGASEYPPEATLGTAKLVRLWDSDTQIVDNQGAAFYRYYRLETSRNIPPGDYRFKFSYIGSGGVGHNIYAGELLLYLVPDGAHARPGDVGTITHCPEFLEVTGQHDPGPFMGTFGDAYVVEVIDHNGHWVGGTPHGHETQANQAWTADGNAVTPGATVQGPFGSVTWTADDVIKDQTDTHELIAFTQTRTFSGGKHSTVVDGTWRRSYTPGGCLVGGWVAGSSGTFRPTHGSAPGETKIGTLSIRTNDTSGRLALEGAHGITVSNTIFIDWGGGSRESVDVDAVAGNNVDFSGGTGPILPGENSGITAAAYVSIRPYTPQRVRYGITFANDPDANMSLYSLLDHEGGEFDLPDRRRGFLADRRVVFYDDIEGASERNVGRVFVLDWDIAAATGIGNSDIDQAANSEKMRTGIFNPPSDNSVLYTYYADGHLACAVDDPFHAEWDMYFVEENYLEKAGAVLGAGMDCPVPHRGRSRSRLR